MRAVLTLTLKLTGLALVFVCCRLASRHPFSFLWSLALMWGTVALVPVLAVLGCWLFDRDPTRERAELLTVLIHYAEMMLLGCGLIVALRFTQGHPMARVVVPKVITSPLVKILGIFATLTVLNLAIPGLGLPLPPS